MRAMEEQARRELAENRLRLGVGHLSEARVQSDELDPKRAEKAENNERRQRKLAGRVTNLNRCSILTNCPDSAPQRYSLGVVSPKTRR